MLIKDIRHCRYTKAINSGITFALKMKCTYLIQLSSGVILTSGWLEALLSTFDVEHDIGAVGPLSNAATFQSVPELANADGGRPNNTLPPGWNIDSMSRLVFLTCDNKVKRIAVLGGFLIAYKANVFRKVGLFDTKISPLGYADEVDFAIRMQNFGFKLVVNPSVYVYHDMGRSFSENEMFLCNEETKIRLEDRYPNIDSLKSLKMDMILNRERKVLRHFLTPAASEIMHHGTAVLFVLNTMGSMPEFTLRGGWISLIQEAVGLSGQGFYVRVAVPRKLMGEFVRCFPEANKRAILLGFESSTPAELVNELRGLRLVFDFLVATHYTTVDVIFGLKRSMPNAIHAYYVQDIESKFNGVRDADETYKKFQKDGFVFVKTRFLQLALERDFGVLAYLIPPTVDSSRYHPVARDFNGILNLCAMVRASTPRRQPFETILVLNEIARRFRDKVSIFIFGSHDYELMEWRMDPSIVNLGVLDAFQASKLYYKCHVFLDFSLWQAFGRSGLEMMATGGIAILPETGGAYEYAIHGENAFLIDTKNVKSALKILSKIMKGEIDLKRISYKAAIDSSRFSIESSSRKTASIFKEVQEEWKKSRNHKLAFE